MNLTSIYLFRESIRVMVDLFALSFVLLANKIALLRSLRGLCIYQISNSRLDKLLEYLKDKLCCGANVFDHRSNAMIKCCLYLFNIVVVSG